MTRFRSVRVLHPSLLFFILIPLCSPAATAQAPAKVIEQQCVAMDYAPDGRLAYAVRRVITIRRVQMQRDDVWLLASDGKTKRIVDGEKLVQGGSPFSYSIQSLRWAPDGRNLTVEMTIRFYTDYEKGETEDSYLTLLIDERGKELKIGNGDGTIPEADNATWLADGATVVYQTEAVKPKLLFGISKVRPLAGRGSPIFQQSQFASIAWDAPRNRALALERDPTLTNPPQIVLLDLLRETRTELHTPKAYLGKLSVSPSGKKFAYFRDHDTLEIREIANPGPVATIRVAFADYAWVPDETQLLVKRGMERKNSDLMWFKVPPAGGTVSESAPVLHGTPFRGFDFSPDGRWLAVIEPGKQNIQIYPLQP